MTKKEKDTQELLALMDDAMQNGKSDSVGVIQLQKMQMDVKESQDQIAALQQELATKDEVITKLRKDLARTQVAHRRMSSHFTNSMDDGNASFSDTLSSAVVEGIYTPPPQPFLMPMTNLSSSQ